MVRFENDGDGLWVRFDEPASWIETRDLEAVPELLARIEDAARDGQFAVGVVGYEAAPIFDPALAVIEPPALRARQGGAKHSRTAATASPLLAFGLFRRATIVADPIPPFSAPLRPRVHTEEQVSATDYRDAIAEIRRHIGDGDVYQVNYTFPLRVSASMRCPDQAARPSVASPDSDSTLGDQLFRQLCRSQGGAYACRLTGPGIDVVSGSPELFFERNEDRITCRPMKGTAARGRFVEEDERLAAELRASPKERAENLMIVDMMRNDLGRIARSGSVTVDHLFEIERLPTLHQMTSTVTARTDASLPQIFGALFPCASITGAPKSSAMRIIAELEQAPRGLYTGAQGVVLPASPDALGWTAGADCARSNEHAGKPPYARFGVAIRTAWQVPAADGLDTGQASPGGDRAETPYRYGIGSGVVWDSRADSELAETRSKALGLGLERPAFELLETMALRGTPPGGERRSLERVRLWPEHRTRLLESAHYFAFRIDIDEIESQLTELCRRAAPDAQRLRLRVAVDGTAELEVAPLAPRTSAPWRLGLCSRPVDAEDPFLFHKTTRRSIYTERLAAVRARLPEADDAILQNEHGAVTETTIANILVPPTRPGEPWRTPPRTDGLLAGTLRASLLRRGRIIESHLSVEDLMDAERILLINSVRGVFSATLDSCASLD